MSEIPRSPDDFITYLPADCTYRLSVQFAGKEICTFTVPKDERKLIMIQTCLSENPFSKLEQPYPKTFQGDFVLRIAQIHEEVEHAPCREIMANSPFELILKDSIIKVSKED